MKLFLLFLSSIISCASFSQVLNGSFENNSGPDLSNWESTCGVQSFNNAPAGGGNWCAKVDGGNFQGCFYGYLYQTIPSITNGQSFVLSGWAYSSQLTYHFGPVVGIYFGKIKNGYITLQAGDTNTSTSWKQLSVQSSFNLSPGDTAAVILSGGIITGAAQCYGYFDLIKLQPLTEINSTGQKQSLKVVPNPFSEQTILKTDYIFKDAMLLVYNSTGQLKKRVNNISGQTITFHRDNLPGGLYFLTVTQDDMTFNTTKILIVK
jgi:hypothetical protein